MPPSPLHVHQLPTELWFAICDCIVAFHDLAALARTCKYFHNVTGPSLYSRIAWTSSNYGASMAALSDRPELFRNVQMLSLQDFPIVASWDWSRLDLDHQLNDFLRPPHSELSNKHAGDLPKIVDLIPKFPHLHVLSFRRVQLPHTLYSDLKRLPALTTLHLRMCNLTAVTPKDNSDLHLRTLRLDNLRWAHNSDASRDAMCSLACSAELEHLEVDPHIASVVFSLIKSTAAVRDVPVGLRSLRTEARSDEAGDFLAIADFLAHAPALEVLHLRRVPKGVGLPSGALPNLRVLHGPAHCVEAFVQHRPVEHVRILDQQPATRQHHNALLTLLAPQHHIAPHLPGDPQATATSWSDVVQVMERVVRAGPPLRRLEFRLTFWDKEVLYMLAQLFPHLRHLRIICTLRGPSEDFMVEFASQFMAAFPQLESLHIFGDRTLWRGRDEMLSEIRAHIGHWERHNKQLKEVAMSSDIVWRKYGERDWGMTDPVPWARFGHYW